MRRLPVLLTVLPCLALIGAAPAARPQRILSLNLCADQYLLALADRAQIVALTRLSRDPLMSAGARAAATLPVSSGSAEDVLALRPDLLLAGPGWRNGAMARLKSLGIRTAELPPAESYAEIVRQVRAVATAVGHPERGEALVRRMDARLARLPRNAGRGRVAAYYQRRGFLTGTGTLVDELMRRLGLINLAARLDRSPLSRVSLEQMALARPDYLIVETAIDTVPDQGTEMLHHPVLRGIPRLRIPEAWTVCGGPAYVLAADSLARQLGRR